MPFSSRLLLFPLCSSCRVLSGIDFHPLSKRNLHANIMPIPSLQLGVVETIYEDELEAAASSNNNTPSTLALSPTHSGMISSTVRTAPHEHHQPFFPSSSLRRRVRAWCQATGLPTDVIIRVGNRSFNLHKSVLVRRSGYMKELLSDTTQINLEEESLIKPETFDVVARFCYGAEVELTPFNVAALLCTTEFFDMTNDQNVAKPNLCQRIDAFLSKVVMPHRDNILLALHSSLPLLPRSEHLVRTCIEGLTAMDDYHGLLDWKDAIVLLPVYVFFRVMDSMKVWTHNHDIIYEIIRLYTKGHPDLAEAERNRIYGFLDCNKVSLETLIQVVRNPEVPLRLTIHAMFTQQLKVRDIIQKFSSAPKRNCVPKISIDTDSLSLREIIRRDGNLREEMQLRSEMEATHLRIKELGEHLLSLKGETRGHQKHRDRHGDITVGGSEKSCGSHSPESKPFGKLVSKGLRTVLRKSNHGLEEYRTAVTLQDHLDGPIDQRRERTKIKSGLTHRRSHSVS